MSLNQCGSTWLHVLTCQCSWLKVNPLYEHRHRTHACPTTQKQGPGTIAWAQIHVTRKRSFFCFFMNDAVGPFSKHTTCMSTSYTRKKIVLQFPTTWELNLLQLNMFNLYPQKELYILITRFQFGQCLMLGISCINCLMQSMQLIYS